MTYEHHNLISWFSPFEHFSHGHFLVGFLSLMFWIFAIYLVLKLLIGYRAKKIAKNIGMQRLASLAVTVVVSFLLFTSVAHAMCPVGFAPPGRIYHPDDNTHGLLVFESGQEKLILEPSFSGNATDFGLVLPLPGKPKITEAPEKLFQELEDLTNPIRSFEGDFAPQSLSVGKSPPSGVRVIEQKDVGDFKTTTLIADSSSALIQWLDENNYRYNPADKENFEYYVQQNGYFFVAMKVNMERAEIDSRGFLEGKLKPIQFSFTTDKPMLPLRSMAGDMEQMSFTLYTLAGDPYYIPAVEIIYSKKVSFGDLETAPSLLKYNALGQWLVRNEVRFDPKKIGQDLFLERGNNNLVVESPSNPKRVNPHLLAANSGIVNGTRGQLVYLDEPTSPPQANGGFPLLALMRIVGVIVVIGLGFWAFKKLKIKRQSRDVQSQVDSEQVPDASTRDAHTNFLTSRNVLPGLVSAIATISLAYASVWLAENPSSGMFRFDADIMILILIATGLVFLLFILGPAIFTAARHGWKSFVSVVIAELLIIILFVILRVVFPIWNFIPHLF